MMLMNTYNVSTSLQLIKSRYLNSKYRKEIKEEEETQLFYLFSLRALEIIEGNRKQAQTHNPYENKPKSLFFAHVVLLLQLKKNMFSPSFKTADLSPLV